VFFNSRIEEYDYNPAAHALKIANYAKLIGATGQVSLRINENIKILSNWLPVEKSPANSDKSSTKREKSNYKLSFIARFIFVVIVLILIIIGNKSPKKNIKRVSDKHNNPIREYVKENRSNYKKESKYKGNSLKNGTSPYDNYYGRGLYSSKYENSILFKNGYEKDAVVFLIDYYSNKVIRNEYIKAGTNFKMTKITNGYYYIKVYSGKDWNPYKIINNGKLTGGFDTNYNFYKSSDNLIHLMDNGRQYSVHTITLYTVRDGNMRKIPISESDFFN
jgi:hypothetical protein